MNKKLVNEELIIHINDIKNLIGQNRLNEALILIEQNNEAHSDQFEHQFLSGVINLLLGRYTNAESALSIAIELDPNSALAHFNLGLALEKKGGVTAAIQQYTLAIELHAGYLEAYFNRGNLYQLSQDFSSALQDFKKVLEINPNIAEAHGCIGNIYQSLGNISKATIYYNNAIEKNPFLYEALINRGKIYLELKKYGEAIADFTKATQINPDNCEFFYLQGLAYEANSNDHFALNSFSKAIELDAKHLSSLIHRSKIYINQKLYENALKDFNQILNIEPNSAEVRHNKGMALEKMHRFNDAISEYRMALSLKPDSAETYNNLGNVLRETNQLSESIQCFEKAIQLKSDYAPAFSNLGWTQNVSRDLDSSISNLKKALDLNPNLAEAHLNIAFSYLAKGNYLEGFKEYEWRHQVLGINVRKLSSSLWLGEEPLEGKTIFIYPEQGLGDTIQFCRYAKLLSNLGARVILEVQPPLFKLLESLEGVDLLINSGAPIPQHDYYCPLMSLPLAFKTQIDTIPNRTPYITANPGKVLHWKDRLGIHDRPRIGLVWSGGFRADQPELWTVNQRRNIPFEEISKIDMPGVDFYSLQKGEPAQSDPKRIEAWSNNNFFDYADELRDFEDTASLIENLDLIVSVDTSTAHLAGALNKSVLLLNRFDSCWRWSPRLNENSLWYPTIRINDQKNPVDWHAPIEDIKQYIWSYIHKQNDIHIGMES